MRLTDTNIRTAKHPKAGQYFLWDDLLVGFGIRLTPTKKSYVVAYRKPDGVRMRETLRGARVGSATVAQARDAARKRLLEVASTTKLDESSVPLRVAMRKWFERQTEIADWRPTYRKKVDALISSYVEGDDRPRLTLNATAKAAVNALGTKSVGMVTRSDVIRVVDNIKPGVAEQFMAIVSSYFGAAYERAEVTGNPARSRLKVLGGRRVRHRKISDDEYKILLAAFRLEKDPSLAAFELLAYTGARRREITGLRWDEVDLEAGTITLPPERRKTGKKDPEPFVINLHPGAADTIRRQPRLVGSPFVFWGRRDKAAFDFQHSVLTRVKPVIPDWRLHDLRRYMRSGLSKLRVPQEVAEQCLGHKPGGIVATYDAHEYNVEKAEAWQKWGDHLASLTAAS